MISKEKGRFSNGNVDTFKAKHKITKKILCGGDFSNNIFSVKAIRHLIIISLILNLLLHK